MEFKTFYEQLSHPCPSCGSVPVPWETISMRDKRTRMYAIQCRLHRIPITTRLRPSMLGAIADWNAGRYV